MDGARFPKNFHLPWTLFPAKLPRTRTPFSLQLTRFLPHLRSALPGPPVSSQVLTTYSAARLCVTLLCLAVLFFRLEAASDDLLLASAAILPAGSFRLPWCFCTRRRPSPIHEILSPAHKLGKLGCGRGPNSVPPNTCVEAVIPTVR